MTKAYIEAHKYSINHQSTLEKDAVCGCFHCLKLFDPKEINEWIPDKSGTAVCPYCGIDSIIGASSGFPMTLEFLAEMEQYWFNDSGEQA